MDDSTQWPPEWTYPVGWTPPKPLVFEPGPRGGLIHVCECGTRNRRDRTRSAWSCAGCHRQFHGTT